MGRIGASNPGFMPMNTIGAQAPVRQATQTTQANATPSAPIVPQRAELNTDHAARQQSVAKFTKLTDTDSKVGQLMSGMDETGAKNITQNLGSQSEQFGKALGKELGSSVGKLVEYGDKYPVKQTGAIIEAVVTTPVKGQENQGEGDKTYFANGISQAADKLGQKLGLEQVPQKSGEEVEVEESPAPVTEQPQQVEQAPQTTKPQEQPQTFGQKVAAANDGINQTIGMVQQGLGNEKNAASIDGNLQMQGDKMGTTVVDDIGVGLNVVKTVADVFKIKADRQEGAKINEAAATHKSEAVKSYNDGGKIEDTATVYMQSRLEGQIGGDKTSTVGALAKVGGDLASLGTSVAKSLQNHGVLHAAETTVTSLTGPIVSETIALGKECLNIYSTSKALSKLDAFEKTPAKEMANHLKDDAVKLEQYAQHLEMNAEKLENPTTGMLAGVKQFGRETLQTVKDAIKTAPIVGESLMKHKNIGEALNGLEKGKDVSPKMLKEIAGHFKAQATELKAKAGEVEKQDKVAVDNKLKPVVENIKATKKSSRWFSIFKAIKSVLMIGACVGLLIAGVVLAGPVGWALAGAGIACAVGFGVAKLVGRYRANKEINKTATEHSQAKTTLTEARKEKTELEGQIHAKKDELQNVKVSLLTMQGPKEELQQKKAGLENELKELEGKLTEVDAKITSTKSLKDAIKDVLCGISQPHASKRLINSMGKGDETKALQSRTLLQGVLKVDADTLKGAKVDVKGGKVQLVETDKFKPKMGSIVAQNSLVKLSNNLKPWYAT